MRVRAAATLLILTLFIYTGITAQAEDAYHVFLPFVVSPPRLENGDFEGGQSHDNRYWIWPWHQDYVGWFNEVRPGIGWTAWWVENDFCPRNEEYITGRPEFTLIFDYEDPHRVTAGHNAAKQFTFWRCGHFGLYQQVSVSGRDNYKVVLQAHVWYTSCSSDLYGEIPKDSDCNPINPNEYMTIRIGVDPTGGNQYWSGNILWSDAYSRYGHYGEALISPEFMVAEPSIVTIWVEALSSQPLKHNDLYVDSVVLEYVP